MLRRNLKRQVETAITAKVAAKPDSSPYTMDTSENSSSPVFRRVEREAEVVKEPAEYRYGQMLINNTGFKETLQNEIKQWLNGIGTAMHSKYKNELDMLYAQINDLDKKLDRSINDLDDIRSRFL